MLRTLTELQRKCLPVDLVMIVWALLFYALCTTATLAQEVEVCRFCGVDSRDTRTHHM